MNPYERFAQAQRILRDELAIDRTRLANERTLMAYLRGGVTLILAGVSILHFSQAYWFFYMGIACLPLGVFSIIFGLWRFRRMDGRIRKLRMGVVPPDSLKSPSGGDVPHDENSERI